jgi:glucokinase
MDERVVLGVDIGGTKVAVGLVKEGGEILHKTSVPMRVTGTAADAMECVHRAIQNLTHANADVTISAIGVSSPGPLDPRQGIVLHSPNLPCWRNFHLLEEIERSYKLPTRIDNDANAAGLAEAVWGAGAGYQSVFYATLGTGIGTAIILNRNIFHGRTGAAAEGGHMTLDFRGPARCGCGKPGCIEGLASGPAIAARTREYIAGNGGRGATILALANGQLRDITAETVVKAWHQGDALAQEILVEMADLIAVWLGSIIDLLEPEVIVIGGGLGARISDWFAHIQSRIPAWSINTRASEIPIVVAKYGADAGIAGSAALWLCESSQEVAGATAERF